MKRKAIMILDCGATNVKACLVDIRGKIISSFSQPNKTVPDRYFKGGLIWDIEDIWAKLTESSRKICRETDNIEIIAVTVTTFGVDGAPMKKDGTLCYPVISWQCGRTKSIEQTIEKYFNPDWLYRLTGLQSYHFNTLFKLIWLRENKPDVLSEMDYFVMMPSLIIQRLNGEFVTDTTMSGTSMLTDNKKRAFSEEILNPLGLSSASFPPMVEPGTLVGKITLKAAEALGIHEGIPVVACGHDTQFAILGSGAGINQPVLSSGTWEILMVRANSASLQIPFRHSGVTIEFDSKPGLVDIGVQWVASGVLEWIGKIFFTELTGNSKYAEMIREAEAIPVGSNGVLVIPELFPGGFSGKNGNINGFTHETTRAHFYRATLEALSYYTRYGLNQLQKVGNYQAKEVICVGGGSKNRFWNQMRADVLGLPVKVLDNKETTALGAAMISLVSMGIYGSIEEAFTATGEMFEEFLPGDDHLIYKHLYDHFVERVFSN